MSPSLPPSGPPGTPWAIPIVVTLLVAALLIWRSCVGFGNDAPPAATTTVNATSAPDASVTPSLPRCIHVSERPFVVGMDDTLPRPKAPNGDASSDQEPDDSDELVPYAVEVGRGAVYEDGFAVGATHEEKGGTAAMLATVRLDGRGGTTVSLGRTRGDMDPPVVAGAGKSVLAALVQPNAGGRSIRVAKITGGDVNLGPRGIRRP